MNDLPKKYGVHNIGCTGITNEGYEVTVIDGGTTPGHVTVKIQDYIFETRARNIKQGSIKYVFHKSVYGVGYFGSGDYSSPKHKKAYDMWNRMLERAYCPKAHINNPSYKDVTVCEEWHNFQTFAKWFYEESNYTAKWQLDKDLLSKGTKIYSPSTCIFIPSQLNSFLITTTSLNTSGYRGVTWKKREQKFQAMIRCVKTGRTLHLGYFLLAEDGYEAYLAARAEQVKVWQEKMKGLLPGEAIAAIR